MIFKRYIKNILKATFVFSLSAYVFGEATFEDSEIRVIRPRFMSKTNSFELGLQGNWKANQTFINSILIQGVLAFHFTNYLALEFDYSYGWTIDKEEFTILNNDFGIKTVLLRPKNALEALLVWTVMYGKFQIGREKLLYFDTVVEFGGGLAGTIYNYDRCLVPRAAALVSYPMFTGGFGQRIYATDTSSIKWDLKYQLFKPQDKYDDCIESTNAGSSYTETNIQLSLGYTYFLN